MAARALRLDGCFHAVMSRLASNARRLGAVDVVVVMGRDPANKRLFPAWWDHQRHTLVNLRRSLQRALQENLVLTRGQCVVDIGCGNCPYEPLFRSRGCQYIRCDLEGQVDIRIANGEPIALPDASADGVVSFQVLEHVWNLDWYLGECHRILKPGGWMLLSTHGTWLYHPHPTDYRRWTRDGIIRELGDRGFKVELVDAAVGPLAWTTQFRLLGMRHVIRKIPVLGQLVLLPLICVMNIRMVVEDAITPASIRESNACIYVTFSRKADRLKEAGPESWPVLCP